MKFWKKTNNKLPEELQWELSGDELRFSGKLTLPFIDARFSEIRKEAENYSGKQLKFVLENVTSIDSAGVSCLNFLTRQLDNNGISVRWERVPENIKSTAETFSLEKAGGESVPGKTPWIGKVGETAYDFIFVELRNFVSLTADVMFWTVTDIFIHRHRRKGEFFNQGVLIGANAVLIIGLIAFLIGLVLALQSAAQLRQFGAKLFVVDLVVISMTREMGPLLTAIMVAGRSGSAIASEIGTMVVTEEVDALKTMSFNPVRFLVIPKMHAMIFSLPLLTTLANILGIFGGMTISYLYLNINPMVFYTRMVESLLFLDLLTGFIKSLIFAGLIVITASYYGFSVKGGAEGVGRITTASVVTSIFLVILADSILGLLFYLGY